MTLVITEVSEAFGCVVVGDSAVTKGTNVVYGAEKIHYSSAANIGFAIWGNACLVGQRVDEIIALFVSGLDGSTTPRNAGLQLAMLLNERGMQDGRDWLKLRGGVHICGYQNTTPVLFHVHTGHDPPEPQGPFQLHEDYPNATAGYHLRNGYYHMFAGLFDGMQHYAERLGQLGFRWPNGGVEDRVAYYSIMVETVARTLEAAGRQPSVGGLVSALAFNRSGIQVDKRIPRGEVDFCCTIDGGMSSFGVI
jgi:hypothetical protein